MMPDLPSRLDPLSRPEREDRSSPGSPFAIDPADDVESMRLASGRMISLAFIKAALVRQRRLWLGLAVVGLLIGAGFHVAVPVKYSATATVYLTHASDASATVAAQDDLAMLGTNAVGTRAVALLHEPKLTPRALLGKLPGTLLSDNVLLVTAWGPSSVEAVRRVDALTHAFLALRASQYDAQIGAVIAAATRQTAKLQSQVTALTAKIATTSTNGTGELAALENQRTAALSQLTGLRAAIQQDELNKLAVTQGSKVLSPGTAVPVSKKKVFALDALSGLAAGLGGGLLLVIALAVMSDRARRREDVAGALGAPVALSVGQIGGGFVRRRSVLASALEPSVALRRLARFFEDQLLEGDLRHPTCLVVAVGDSDPAAAALVALAVELADTGDVSVLVDATADRSLAGAFDRKEVGLHSLEVGTAAAVTLLVPPPPWDDPAGTGAAADDAIASADAVLVLASVDPSVGAAHLRRWGSRAVVTVSAGKSTVQRLAATAELLESAGVQVLSSALVGADPSDDSVGMPVGNELPQRREAGLLAAPHASAP